MMDFFLNLMDNGTVISIHFFHGESNRSCKVIIRDKERGIWILIA